MLWLPGAGQHPGVLPLRISRRLTSLSVSVFCLIGRSPPQGDVRYAAWGWLYLLGAHTQLVQIQRDEGCSFVQSFKIAVFTAGYMRDAATPNRPAGFLAALFEPNLDDERIGITLAKAQPATPCPRATCPSEAPHPLQASVGFTQPKHILTIIQVLCALWRQPWKALPSCGGVSVLFVLYVCQRAKWLMMKLKVRGMLAGTDHGEPTPRQTGSGT
jgi:hypothetical protein